jgi:potassium-transporting ATPase KdpC subunit
MMRSLSIGRHAAASVVMLAILTVALGFGYPAVVTLISRGIFPSQSAGSLVYARGELAGSALLAQPFTDAKGNPLPRYFQPRPSATGYNGAGSGASNLGPTNPVLITTITERLRAYRAFNHLAATVPVPVDAVTASGSGLDPDISVQNALDQAPRVAAARHLAAVQVVALVHQYTGGAQWGFLSEPVVNVLNLNLALDGQR